jgi:site-specific recombinase XerD
MGAQNHPSGLTNQSLIRDYMTYRRHDWPSQETRRVRNSQLGQAADALGSLAVATEDDLLAWHDSLTGSRQTIASYTSAVRGFYHWLTAVRRARPDDPTALLRRPRVPRGMPRPMLDRHYDLALACALTDPEMYLWLGLMGCSGLRCCEIAWMRTHDLDERADGTGIARIVGKGGKRRAVPIGSTIVRAMRPFLYGSGYVFTRQDGRPYTPKRVSARTNAFLRGIGVSETAHSMRHRFGTDYHALDPDILRQARIMGHASIETTQVYTEITPEVAAEYVERLALRRLAA